MEFTLIRNLFTEQATHGNIFLNGSFLAHTLERPWLNNQRKVSCIPAGRYRLKRRTSLKFGVHLCLQDVPDRDLILIHPANYVRQLEGCIAPGMSLGDVGKIWDSKVAVNKITALAFPALQWGEEVWLTIQNAPQPHETTHQQSLAILESVHRSGAYDPAGHSQGQQGINA